MITWDNAQTIVQKLSSDTGSDTLTFLKLMMNVGYKQLLIDLGRPITEKTQKEVIHSLKQAGFVSIKSYQQQRL